MDPQYEPIQRLLDQVRLRYRAVALYHAIVRAALAASACVGLFVAAAALLSLSVRSPLTLALVAAFSLLLSVSAMGWALWPVRQKPSDRHVARFVEERVTSLDDRLATAVDVVSSAKAAVNGLVRDAARHAAAVDLNDVVPSSQLRRSGFQAAAATVVLLVVVFMAREPARQSLDAASLALFPGRVSLDVVPGDIRLKEGATLSVDAHLAGNSAPVAARVEIENGSTWRPSEMAAAKNGHFMAQISGVSSDFRYRVVAGTVTSPIYRVRVAAPPRVARIDVDYIYPAALGLAPRTETDGGDVYAPTGTTVRLHIHTQHPVAKGSLALPDGPSPLTPVSATELTASMAISSDGSYRVSLFDSEGLGSASEPFATGCSV